MKKNNDKSNIFEIIKYNYDNTEGFDSAFKILIFLVFSIIIILVARTTANYDSNENKNTSSTTTNVANKQNDSLKQILDGIKNKDTSITINAPSQNNLVIKLTSLKEEDGLVTAFYESNHHGYQRLQIQNGAFYEIPAGSETPIENDDLLPKMNYKFLVPSELIRILETNKATPIGVDEGIVYSYSYEDESDTSDIKVEVKKDEVTSITITNSLHTYEIIYK